MERDLSNGRNGSCRTSQTESTANRTAGPRGECGRSQTLRPLPSSWGMKPCINERCLPGGRSSDLTNHANHHAINRNSIFTNVNRIKIAIGRL